MESHLLTSSRSRSLASSRGVETTHSEPFTPELLQEWLNSSDRQPEPLQSQCDASTPSVDLEDATDDNTQAEAAVGTQSCLIRTAYQACIRYAKLLWQIAMTRHSLNELQQATLRQALGRLYLWGDDIEWNSLTKCMEEETDLQDNILEILRNVAKSLKAAFTQVERGHELPKALSLHAQTIDTIIEQITFVISEDEHSDPSDLSDSDDSDDSDDSEDGHNGSLTQICDDLESHTAWLMEILPTLERTVHLFDPAQEREECRHGGPDFEVSEAAQHFVSQVQDKFRHADRRLVERLGEANWERFLRIRQAQEFDDGCGRTISKTAKSLFKAQSIFQDSGLGSSLPTNSICAQSLASHSSFASTASAATKGCLRVPSTPREVAAGIPFQCFLCKKTQKVLRNRVDWKLHVFRDLAPYICTFSDCSNALTTFPSRAHWAEHEFTHHRRIHKWRCHECSIEFATTATFKIHLETFHRFKIAEGRLQAALESAHETTEMDLNQQECPLCFQIGFKTRRSFVTHVARHMEEVALSSLPRDVQSDSEDQPEDSSSSSSTACQDVVTKELIELQDSDKLNSPPNDSTSLLPNISGTDRPPVLEDATTYLHMIRRRFSHQPEVCNEFLSIVKDFKSRHIDEEGVMRRVSLLFQGHPTLIQGFNGFLPPGYRIDCELDGNLETIHITTPSSTITQSLSKNARIHVEAHDQAKRMKNGAQGTPVHPGHSGHLPPPPTISPPRSAQNRSTSNTLESIGAVDLPYPPSSKNPAPDPPTWLIASIASLKNTHPFDQFEATMHYTPFDASIEPPAVIPLNSVAAAIAAGKEIKYEYSPWIRCHDCPGKLYTPGPEPGIENFEVHLKNREHRERIHDRRVKALETLL